MVTPAAPLVKTGSMQLGARLPGCVVERHGRVPVGGQREEGEVEHLLEPCRSRRCPALHKFTASPTNSSPSLQAKQRTNDLPGRCARLVRRARQRRYRKPRVLRSSFPRFFSPRYSPAPSRAHALSRALAVALLLSHTLSRAHWASYHLTKPGRGALQDTDTHGHGERCGETGPRGQKGAFRGGRRQGVLQVSNAALLCPAHRARGQRPRRSLRLPTVLVRGGGVGGERRQRAFGRPITSPARGGQFALPAAPVSISLGR